MACDPTVSSESCGSNRDRVGEARPSRGCELDEPRSFPADEATDAKLDVERGPSPRPYRVIGAADEESIPALFLSMHGCGGDHRVATAGVRNVLAAQGVSVLTVGPDSAVADASGDGDGRGDDGAKCWTLDPAGYDLSFVERLLESVRSEVCVDEAPLFIGGGSSGGFAAQAFGCRLGATAIASDRGGVHHPEGLFNFPPTPPPPAEACGPIPTLLGFARDDEVIDYETYAPVAQMFWRENNACGSGSERDAQTEAVVCRAGLPACRCDRFVDCDAPVVTCAWDGGHDAYGVGPEAMAWWFARSLSADTDGPRCE